VVAAPSATPFANATSSRTMKEISVVDETEPFRIVTSSLISCVSPNEVNPRVWRFTK